MTLVEAVLVAAAGLVAGAVNAAAGGGTLISFPALLAAGLPPVSANVTSAAGLLTGYLGGTIGYRRELGGQGHRFRSLGAVTVLGSLTGATLLLVLPAKSFEVAVPYLVLASCLLLAGQPRLGRLVAARGAHRARPGAHPAALAGVFVAAAYGAYFGAALGVLLLGVLGIVLDDHLQRINALKSLLSLVVNVVKVLIFSVFAPVHWGFAAILLVTAYAGGLTGASIARRLAPAVLRAAVVVLGSGVAVALAVRG